MTPSDPLPKPGSLAANDSAEPTPAPRPSEAEPPIAGSADLPASTSAAGVPADHPAAPSEPGTAETSDGGAARRRILIGSQRDPAAYRARRRDWIPVDKATKSDRPARLRRGAADGESGEPAATEDAAAEGGATEKSTAEGGTVEGGAGARGHAGGRPGGRAASGKAGRFHRAPRRGPSAPPRAGERKPAPATSDDRGGRPTEAMDRPAAAPSGSEDSTPGASPPEPEGPARSAGRAAVPNLRERLTPELEAEFDRAIGGESLDALLAADALAGQPGLEPEARVTGRVMAVRRDDVFVELGQREQGVVPLTKFEQPPAPGETIDVVVQRFNAEDGVYELGLPSAAIDVEDWGDLKVGMLVEARVTGHNAGGLEAEVNRIRAFIPISQIDLYRVEDLAPYVDQRLCCLVTEANPERRNLVLSRRAVLEREKEETRRQFLESLEPGQIHEGVVRKLMDFGAFVDLGGVDGLVHISQLSWARVAHPREVITEGQRIQVRVEKVDRQTGKIGLSYRAVQENPWTHAAAKYPPQSIVQGKVTRLAEFGAFVELEPGIEGLVHISELAYRRVWRVGDVLSEGQSIEAMVLSCDPEAQRIGLSIKALAPKPEPPKTDQPAADDAEAAAAPAAPESPKPKKKAPDKPLLGGLGRKGRDRYGLRW